MFSYIEDMMLIGYSRDERLFKKYEDKRNRADKILADFFYSYIPDSIEARPMKANLSFKDETDPIEFKKIVDNYKSQIGKYESVIEEEELNMYETKYVIFISYVSSLKS